MSVVLVPTYGLGKEPDRTPILPKICPAALDCNQLVQLDSGFVGAATGNGSGVGVGAGLTERDPHWRSRFKLRIDPGSRELSTGVGDLCHGPAPSVSRA